jgi:hypothetical protein
MIMRIMIVATLVSLLTVWSINAEDKINEELPNDPEELKELIIELKETIEEREEEIRILYEELKLDERIPSISLALEPSLMQNIIIPEIEFNLAKVDDFVSILKRAITENPPPSLSEHIERREKRIAKFKAELKILKKAKEENLEKNDTFSDIVLDLSEDFDRESIVISFTAKYITFGNVLKILAEVTNLKFKIENSALIITDK